MVRLYFTVRILAALRRNYTTDNSITDYKHMKDNSCKFCKTATDLPATWPQIHPSGEISRLHPVPHLLNTIHFNNNSPSRSRDLYVPTPCSFLRKTKNIYKKELRHRISGRLFTGFCPPNASD